MTRVRPGNTHPPLAHEILVGLTGGIAAYKTAALVSDLVQSNIGVTVVMTRAATKFVGPTTFRALTGRPVYTRMFEGRDFPLGPHIELAKQAQLLCVAPATAHFMAQAAHGLADDLLTTLLLSFTGPIVVAPAMNTEMWEKPAVQRNLQQLRDDGLHIVDPQEGWLSCRTKGVGRMAEPETIKKTILQALQKVERGKGKGE
ncbi:MAG: phosphopantothenoylcysteine decarboxylase [Pirellulales bacterium]|nr:phosphopantothenoylcysteine decarboxylase [Pirellulales bacterium]